MRRLARGLGVLVLLALVAGTSSTAFAQGASALEQISKRGTLRVGWGVWFPYLYRDPKTQAVTGIGVDIFNEMAKEMKVKVEWVEDNWSTLVAGLQSSKFDITVPMSITLPRALAVTYTKPITKIGIGLMVHKRDENKFRSWQDLDKPDKKITTTMGSSQQPLIQAKFRHAQLLLVKAGPDSIAQVLSGRADAWANPYDSFRHVQKEHPELVVVPGPPLAAQDIAFAVRQGDFVFQQWVNHFIDEQKATGNLLRIIQKYGLEETSLAD